MDNFIKLAVILDKHNVVTFKGRKVQQLINEKKNMFA